MSLFQGDYLRVLTPVTTNGINLVLDASGMPVLKESHLPVSALKELNRQNQQKPQHLKMKIEHVKGFYADQKPPPPKQNSPGPQHPKVKA